MTDVTSLNIIDHIHLSEVAGLLLYVTITIYLVMYIAFSCLAQNLSCVSLFLSDDSVS